MQIAMADPPQLAPQGVLTFLATDVVSSTEIWSRADAASAAMSRHRQIIVRAVHAHGGYLPPDQGEGDSTFAAFRRPIEALAAALEAQRTLAGETWPADAEICVRMAVHTGDAEILANGNYGGLAVIRTTLLRGLAQGGQVLASGVTADTVADSLADGMRLVEVGTVPLGKLERLERVHQLAHPELAPPMERLASPAAYSLPSWATSLVGRAKELAELSARVRESRLVTISGVGGSGKTRMAAAVADAVADDFADGVVWVELARVSTGEQVAGAVASGCHVAESAGTSTLDQLVRRLERAELLLVLDNCEHVIEACADLVEALLARTGPSLHIVTTTRESVAVTGETVWRIPSLSLPPESERDPERIVAHDAVRLFVERARAVRADLPGDAASIEAMAAICRRLDGIPLAIELAAARLGALSLERLADGLDERFRLLTGGARRAVERQRTLLASVEWSYDLLEPTEQALFRRLAVFASPFTLEAAESVAAGEDLDRFEVFEVLARLVDKSLVQHVGDRYRLLETLRQYGLERAQDAGEIDALRGRHLAAFLSRSAEWQLDTRLATEPVLEELIAESPDLIAALDWSLAKGEPALELLRPLNEVWGLTTRIDEARTVLPRVFEALDPDGIDYLEATALAGQTLFLGGIVEPMRVAAARVKEDDLSLELRSRLNYVVMGGWGRIRTNFILEAEDLARTSIEVFRESGARSDSIGMTMNLALAQAQTGKLVESRRTLAWLDQHLPGDVARRHHDVARLLDANLSGDFRQSRRILAALAATRVHVTGLGGQSGLVGLWTRDAELVARAAQLRDQGAFTGVFAGFAAIASGAEALLAGDLERAHAALQEGMRAPAIGAQLIADLLGAEVALSLGRPGEAEAVIESVVEQLDGAEPPLYMAWMDVVRSQVAARAENPGQARQHVHDALDLALTHDIRLIQTDALESLAVFAAKDDQPDMAARLLAACEAFRERGGYRWRPPHREQGLAAIREDLPGDVLADGASPSLSEAAEYARRGRGERGRATHGWDSLTPAEARVVELVVEGLSNKDIASRLFVSTATVKTHLVHVYRKLEIRSRAELAAKASRRQTDGSEGDGS